MRHCCQWRGDQAQHARGFQPADGHKERSKEQQNAPLYVGNRFVHIGTHPEEHSRCAAHGNVGWCQV